MNGFLETLEQFLAYQGLGLTGIVHIGAGACQELPFYRACDPEYLVLVDADEKTCLDLKEETGGLGYCRVIRQAVSLAQSTLELNRFNNTRLNSVLSLEELKIHYHGLKRIDTIEFPSISLDDFLKTLDMPTCEPGEKVSILFLDNCGLDMEVFERETSREPAMFDYIVVRSLKGPAFLNRAADKKVYELIQVDTWNPPFVDQVYKNNKNLSKLYHKNSSQKLLLDEKARELERLEFAFQTASSELESLSSQLETMSLQLKEASSANDRLKKELSTVRQTGAALKNQVETLQEENRELNYRQQMLDQEIMKTEAQLELVKDVVLREKEF